jgi:RNA recognition motif-containing protein
MNRDVKTLKTLWVGDIEAWMDEQYLTNLFGKSGRVIKVKIIRDKATNLPIGYGFVEFDSHEVAAKVLELFNGSTHPGTNRPFRLNWGVHSAGRSNNFENRDTRGGSGMRSSRNVGYSVSFCQEIFLVKFPAKWKFGFC